MEEFIKGSGFGKFKKAEKGYREKLSTPMPKEALKKHPTKTYLTSIKAMFIIERLNDVFGVLGWDFEHEVVDIYDNTYIKDNRAIKIPHLVIKGRIYIRSLDLYTPMQYGGHDLDGKGQDPVDGFKSAVTDCLTKCASLLEIGVQVFKGDPNSQIANKSGEEILTEDDLSNKETIPQIPEPEIKDYKEIKERLNESIPEEHEKRDESIPEEIKESYKKLFGRYPRKDWSLKFVLEKIESKQTEPVEKEKPKEDSFEPVNKPVSELVEKYKEKLHEFLDKESLKEGIAEITLEAQIEGLNEFAVETIKEYARELYKKMD